MYMMSGYVIRYQAFCCSAFLLQTHKCSCQYSCPTIALCKCFSVSPFIVFPSLWHALLQAGNTKYHQIKIPVFQDMRLSQLYSRIDA